MNSELLTDNFMKKEKNPDNENSLVAEETAVDIIRMCNEMLETIKSEMRDVGVGMQSQIENYIKSLVTLNIRRNNIDGGKTKEQIALESAFFKFKLWQFVDSRNRRLLELESPEIAEADQIKEKLFQYGRPSTVSCVDGRVLPKLTAGLTGHATRTPAGDVADVVPVYDEFGNKDSELVEGEFSKILNNRFEKQDVLVEMLDSHVECGAGCANYAHNHSINVEAIKVEAKNNKDDERKIHEIFAKALLADVLRKKEIARALENYVEEKYGQDKKIVSVQYSFDPDSGYSYMGLEKDECLKIREVQKSGYSMEVLGRLSEEGKILSSETIAKEFATIFQDNYFDVDYEAKYQDSTLKFWKNMEKMSVDLLPKLLNKLKHVFPKIKDEKELNDRAIFMLASAYNTYLHTHQEDGSNKHFPYKQHVESVISVTRSEKGPFDRAQAFSVFPNSPDIGSQILFMDGLLRGNRRANRDSGPAKKAREILFKDNDQDFINTTVPVMFFERLAGLNEAEVKRVQSVDWSDLATGTDWYNMSTEEFENYMEMKMGSVDARTFRMVNTLRKRAKEMFGGNSVLKQDMMLTGRLTPVFILSGPHRENVALFPFMIDGYKKSKSKR